MSWIGVDLDATLARYDGWVSHTHIGEPVMPMVERVRAWLAAGRDVRIFTARVSHDGSHDHMMKAERARSAIQQWCKTHLGQVLPVTCEKDMAMVEFWDDKAVQVIPNTGEPVGRTVS